MYKRMCAKIAELEHDIAAKDEAGEAINNVAILNFELAQKDADRIKDQAAKIKELNRVIELNKRLVRKEKNQLYMDMKKKNDKLQNEYDDYKMFTRHEIEVCHNIIDRQKQMHEKLFAELRAIKTVLEVPKFRDSMPKTNMHGTDFNTFTKQLGQIYKDTVTHLVEKAGVPVGSVFGDDELKALEKSKKKRQPLPHDKPDISSESPAKRRSVIAKHGSGEIISMGRKQS